MTNKSLIVFMAFCLITTLAIVLYCTLTPLEVRNIQKSVDSCDCLNVTWDTTIPAQCTVTYCTDGQCFTGGQEWDVSLCHREVFPRHIEKIGILAQTWYGKSTYVEVKP
jgi:hypothetical protein